MCLILLAWRAHPRYELVVAANRDEYFARPTAPADWWADAPQVLAGRDLEAGGTWLGITRQGRFAALTNYRDPESKKTGAPSRGELVSGFLRSEASAGEYMQSLKARAHRYNGFNLLCADGENLHYLSNCGDGVCALPPGIYGVSNHLLDTPWPKVAQGKSALACALDTLPDTEPLFQLLADDQHAPDAHLPRTGVSMEWERLLSAAFVRSPSYGTRSSTAVLFGGDGELRFEERSFAPGGARVGERRYQSSRSPAG